jgi:hypothetical protein
LIGCRRERLVADQIPRFWWNDHFWAFYFASLYYALFRTFYLTMSTSRQSMEGSQYDEGISPDNINDLFSLTIISNLHSPSSFILATHSLTSTILNSSSH